MTRTCNSRDYEKAVTLNTVRSQVLTCATGTARTLIGIGARDRSNLKSIHRYAWIIHLQLAVTRVNHVENSINCE